MTTRDRNALYAFCMALALAGVTQAAQAETLRVGKAGAEAFSFVPADIGQQSGIFKKHGLDLTISAFGGDAKLQQAMAADGIDIGLGGGPGLEGHFKPKALAALARSYVELKTLPREPDMSTLYAEAYLPK